MLRARLRLVFWLLIMTTMISGSGLPVDQADERVRAFTRAIEFDFVDWTLDAVLVKLTQASLGGGSYLPLADQSDVVRSYMEIVRQIFHQEYALKQALAKGISETDHEIITIRTKLDALYQERTSYQPIAESILQSQVASITAELGLSVWGQPFPPVLYHVTPPPSALIVSPRSVIRLDHDISISPDLNIDDEIALEHRIENALDVSTLVVGIGGIGTYPTMVMQTSSLPWMAEVVAHEWIHNLLTFRPLGLNYMSTPALRTMNETTAAIAGKEIGALVIARFYPELVPPPPANSPQDDSTVVGEPQEPTVPVFNFNQEMRETRVKAEALLAEGKITEAEAYMETRRQFFLENGYLIRRINQAYFAFYGAYADTPGGAAGEDPVGAAVRRLRESSPTLNAFIQRIGWMWRYEQLEQAVVSAAQR